MVGIFQRNRTPPSADQVASMAQRLCHDEGAQPDHRVFAGVPIAAGWVARLNAHRTGGPVWNREHSICLIFNGEDFPDESAEEPSRTASLLERYEHDDR